VNFRRVMLVLLPLLGALFVFMVLRLVYIDWETSLVLKQTMPGVDSLTVPVGKERMQAAKGMEHEVTLNLNLVRKDKQGRMEMRFLADRAEHLEKNTTDVERPQIQFFGKGDEIITLMADRGMFVTRQGIKNIADIESGTLWGHVVLVHDRGTPDDHSDDLLVDLENLKFNGETYELTTDGPVVVAGLEVNLSARKMRMTIDRATRRINTMAFMEDIFISLETGDRLRMGMFGSPPETAPAGATKPMTPATGAPPAAPAADTGGSGLWQIDLVGDVDARQAAQRLQCEHLILYNQSGGGAQEQTASGAGGAPGAARRPPDDRQGRREGEAFANAKFLQPGAPPPLVVMARGPLIITPVDAAERKSRPDDLNWAVATGSPVLVDDAQTHIVGAKVQYNTKTGAGSVIGSGTPVLLEQPGRLNLTGDRLDFQRGDPRAGRTPVAEVQGEGQLQALVQTASFTGSSMPKAPGAAPAAGSGAAAGASPPQEPTSTLRASWTRGMRLDFYRLPAGEDVSTGQISRAAFHGAAVIAQQDGLLKGDDLVIDFFRPTEGRGQAVERLQGHGAVFLKNEQAEAKTPPKDHAKDSSKMTVGDITCEDLDITFVRDNSGSMQPKELRASGDKKPLTEGGKVVLINDPQGKIQARDLTVRFGVNEKGSRDAQFLEAFGDVDINREDLQAQGDHVRRDLAAGTILLEGRPARAKRGESRVVGPYVEFSQTDGRARVRGAGELEMPANTDLRGRPRARAEPMFVQWQNFMLFEDKRNFAQFDGNVRAATGGSRLASQRLWIYFADRPQKAAAASDIAAPAAGGAADAPAASQKAKADSGGIQNLFGRKSLVRVLAENDVRAVEQQVAEDKTVRYHMEMTGDNLTYLDVNRKAYIRGPGTLRILSRERAKAGQALLPGLALAAVSAAWLGAVPEGYARTEVAWADSMAYDGSTDRAYFKGSVDTAHIGRGAPGGDVRARGQSGTTRIKSNDLQIVFSEKKPAEAAAPGAPLPPAADESREERMAVEKLVADGSISLWVNDRRGTCERLIYQRDPELIRLYRGPEDWARLWQENEATQEFGQVVARTITYEPSTGRIDVVDQQEMTVTPRPKPPAVPQPRPRATRP
jgi:lipopolysaccharide export system protein LptC